MGKRALVVLDIAPRAASARFLHRAVDRCAVSTLLLLWRIFWAALKADPWLYFIFACLGVLAVRIFLWLLELAASVKS